MSPVPPGEESQPTSAVGARLRLWWIGGGAIISYPFPDEPTARLAADAMASMIEPPSIAVMVGGRIVYRPE